VLLERSGRAVIVVAVLAAAVLGRAAPPVDPALPSAAAPVRLLPVPQTVVDACRRTQARAQGVILCPTALPRATVGWAGGPPPQLYARARRGSSGKRVVGLDIGYGAPWEPGGAGWRQHLWRNRPCCFLHFEVYQRRAGDGVPSGARRVTLGGRRGLLKRAAGYGLGCPGDAYLYWCNHSAFLWTEHGTHYVATLHLFGQRPTAALLGRLVARLQPASRLRRAPVRGIGVGVSPHSLAESEGELWVTAVGDRTPSFRGTIFRVDARRARVSARIHPGRAVALAVGSDALWAVTYQGVARLDRSTGERTALVRTGRWPRAAVLDATRLWVVNAAPFTPRRGSLVGIDTRTNRIVGAPVLLGRGPVALAVGPGSVWVADELEGVLIRIAARTRRVADRIRVGRGPTSVAAGGGAVWVANTGERTVSRVDADTGSVTATVSVGLAPRGLVFTRGALWGVATGAGSIFRIDPATNRVATVVRGLDAPLAVNVAAGRLWVTTNGDGRLLRLRLPAYLR
jgi:virginiamycin B lyase